MERAVERGSRKGSNGWLVVAGMLQVMMIMLAVPGAAFAASVALDWDPSTDTDLAGYRVYYQANSAAIPFSGAGAAEGSAPIDVANTLSATINGLDPANSYYFAVTAYNNSGAESVYSNVVEIKESVPPAVSFTSPTGSTSVTGIIPVTATATDNQSVARVEFYLNGALQSTDTAAPYAFNWNTSSLSTGLYTLSAKAFDAAGNVGQSEVLVAVTGDTTPPAVVISGPGNNARVNGTVTISASATDNIGVTKMELYDNGAMIFAGNQTPVSYNWDSLTAGNGSHVLTAKAYDAAGNVGSTAVSVSAINDFAAPLVALGSPANGATVGATVNAAATATDDIGVTLVEFYVNGTLQSSDSSAPYAFTWNTAAIANGPYTIIAKAYDAAGRVGQSAGVSVNVFNDITAPAVTIASPAAGSTVSGTVNVAANASDNVAVSKVEFYLNGVLKASATSAPYSYTWNTLAAANGAYTLIAKAYDTAGNIGQSATVSVNVSNDTTAPAVSIASPAAGSTVSGTVNVAANASDNVAVSKVEFYLNGVLKATATSPPYSYFWDTLAAANGAYTLIAKAYDAAGNIGQSSAVPVNVSNDLTAPAVSIASPAAGSTVSETVNVAANASDNVAVSKVEFYLNGVLKATATSAPYSYAWDTLSSANGAHVLTAKAFDAAGNIGQSAAATVNVFNDTIAPVVSIASPVAGITVSGTVNVAANASDNVAVSKVEFYLNGVLQATSTSGPYSFNWNASAVTNGTYLLSAKAYDAAGNIGQSSLVTVTVDKPLTDTTAPNVKLLSPTSNYVFGTNATVSASATDNVAVTKMELYIDGSLKLSVANTSFSTTWNFSPGSHTIMVKAYDAANNVKSVSKTVKRFF